MMSKIQENSEIALSDLVLKLIEAGADRKEVLCALRGLGIGDRELSDAFSVAISLLCDKRETVQ
jgi:hypothetical protein